MVLVQAQQDARLLVAEMVDDAVVQSTIARAGVEADIGNAKSAEHLGRNVAAPGDLFVGLSFNSVQLHLPPRRNLCAPLGGRASTTPAPVGAKLYHYHCCLHDKQ